MYLHYYIEEKENRQREECEFYKTNSLNFSSKSYHRNYYTYKRAILTIYKNNMHSFIQFLKNEEQILKEVKNIS